MTMYDREEDFQMCIALFNLGDMDEREFRRRMTHEHNLDDHEVDYMISEFKQECQS